VTDKWPSLISFASSHWTHFKIMQIGLSNCTLYTRCITGLSMHDTLPIPAETSLILWPLYMQSTLFTETPSLSHTLLVCQYGETLADCSLQNGLCNQLCNAFLSERKMLVSCTLLDVSQTAPHWSSSGRCTGDN
jgi:hypothetical protein